jgi:hypothetical protein
MFCRLYRASAAESGCQCHGARLTRRPVSVDASLTRPGVRTGTRTSERPSPIASSLKAGSESTSELIEIFCSEYEPHQKQQRQEQKQPHLFALGRALDSEVYPARARAARHGDCSYWHLAFEKKDYFIGTFKINGLFHRVLRTRDDSDDSHVTTRDPGLPAGTIFQETNAGPRPSLRLPGHNWYSSSGAVSHFNLNDSER